MYTIGLDFGTLSGRAVLVETATGNEIASAVYDYPHGVIDQHLPQHDVPLPPDWALQEPADYLAVLEHTIPAILQEHHISAEQVLGLGIDFTACTMLPTRVDGTPLCWLDAWRDNPHAWVKLWKHHAAQTQAEQITHMAAQMGETWLKRYGGVISSEWFLSKALETLQQAPTVYQAADRFIEAGDWLVWQLTGQESRSVAFAGFKASYQDGAYPSEAYLAALHPDFPRLITSKIGRHITALSQRAGGLSESFASKLGLQPGMAVAVANIDAHAAVPAVKATQAGQMVLIVGTSTCHIISDEKLRELDGVAGVVDGGVVHGLYGYESGQASVGDTFAWFVEHMVPPACHAAAQAEGISLYQYLEQEAARQPPGAYGLVALDWWNGSRSPLMDANLSGLLMGLTLATRPPDIYRALIEATAYGTRRIIDTFEAQGIEIKELITAGGLPERSALLRQIYADVTGRTLKLAGSSQPSALGAAIHAAVAADIYPDLHIAAQHMGQLQLEAVLPDPTHQPIYDQLYLKYNILAEHFGQQKDLMHDLRQMRHRA